MEKLEVSRQPWGGSPWTSTLPQSYHLAPLTDVFVRWCGEPNRRLRDRMRGRGHFELLVLV